MAHLCTQCQVFAQLWDVEAEHSLYRFCEFLYRSAHTLGEDDPQREGGLSALFTSTCVPETGWVVVGGWDQMRSKGWSSWEVEEGDYWELTWEKVAHGSTMMDFFFSLCGTAEPFQAYTQTYQFSFLFVDIFNHSFFPPLGEHLSTKLILFHSLALSRSPSVLFPFTGLITSLSVFNGAVIGGHWEPMIQSHPYS